MPQYSYECTHCKHEFSRILKIADRELPVEEPCPDCEEEGFIYKKIDAPPMVSDTPRTGWGKKLPDGFKDKLREIKKNSGRHCTIDV